MRSVLSFLRSFRQAGIIIGACLLLSACQPTGRLSLLETDALIVAFGDSLTFGTGVTADKSYPMVLSALIRRDAL